MLVHCQCSDCISLLTVVFGGTKLTQPIVGRFKIEQKNIGFRKKGKVALCFAKTFFRCGVFEEADAAFEDHLYACVVFLILKCGALNLESFVYVYNCRLETQRV